MKLNWNTFKVIFAFVVVIGVIFLAVDSVSSRSYSGANLSFDTANGIITVSNPSENPAAVQLTGSGSRTFRVSSAIDGISGSSTRVGSGTTRSSQFDFELPPGTTEFTISGGTDIRFVADTDTELQATVNPMSSETHRNTLIAAAVVILGLLFYASSVTDHQWIINLRSGDSPSGQEASKQDTEPAPVVTDGGQGRAARSYNDNRAER